MWWIKESSGSQIAFASVTWQMDLEPEAREERCWKLQVSAETDFPAISLSLDGDNLDFLTN